MHTGIKMFGPFTAKDCHKERKQYGLLFTCMASRVVHHEVLEDMTTDCCQLMQLFGNVALLQSYSILRKWN